MKERVVQMKRHLEELLREHDVLKSVLNQRYNELQLCADFQEEQIQNDIDYLEERYARVENEIDKIIIALSLGLL